MNPEYPGVIDLPLWEIGAEVVQTNEAIVPRLLHVRSMSQVDFWIAILAQ